jgi:hypothetical protein
LKKKDISHQKGNIEHGNLGHFQGLWCSIAPSVREVIIIYSPLTEGVKGGLKLLQIYEIIWIFPILFVFLHICNFNPVPNLLLSCSISSQTLLQDWHDDNLQARTSYYK